MPKPDNDDKTESTSDLPILDPFEGEDEDDADETPRTVLITGAGGNLGRKLRAAWVNLYDIIALDRRFDPDDPDMVIADLSVWDESWSALFDEADAVVHLAANPDESAGWSDLIGPNIDTTVNVLLATATAGVERFVMASSNHVMRGCLEPGRTGPITTALPPCPISPYGASKLMNERTAKSFAEVFGLTVIALRLGWIRTGENTLDDLPATGDDRELWLSNRDFVRLCTCAIETELDEGSFIVVNGLSANPGSRWTLTEATEQLGYVPEDGIGM